MLGNLVLPEIREFLEKRELRELKSALQEIPAEDIADLIDDLTSSEKGVVFRLLGETLAIEVFEELSMESQQDLIRSLADERLARLLEDMAPDDRTSLLEDLPAKVTRYLINLLSPEERKLALRLLGYPEDSAGRLMTPDLVWAKETDTAEQALRKIREIGPKAETINVCYVVDEARRLKGEVALAGLVLAQPQTPISEIMKEFVPGVSVNTDREEAASLCNKYDILAVPVTDAQGRLVGIVTVDDLVEVLQEEATEDIHVMAGVLPTERPYLELGAVELWWRRVVWLVALILVEMVAGFVLKSNTHVLENFLALGMFITVMTATGGSCGTQSATMVIRAMATGDIGPRDFRRVVFRETMVGGLLGVSLGVFVFVMACLAQWTEMDLRISFVVGSTLGMLVVGSNLGGALLPLLFRRLGWDPALMAGPFITTTVDVVALVLYFSMARLFLGAVLAATG